ncbi:tudor domain-containing protein 5 isoform X2 [Peromyscus californicus insignis]|uniref:tudor domain-containing protein 5 isoform X2 n=1 Tax=Peromyscus californicus insignis TaxID=564181 RepID=UPI0022A7691E|nr:tudor domain-containing protein 5 isoform X2 [Peromyscus californicus insignis]
MSEQERIQDCLRKEIRSLLISTKDGLTPQQLEKEYLLMVGNHLPLRILGYRSTMELVLDMPDVVSVCPFGDGNIILKAIPDESTKGIASLVAKQRRSHKVRNSMQKGRSSACSGRIPYRGRVPPILPAVVKRFPVTKTRFSQPTSNMEPPKQVLNMEKMPTFNTVEISRLNHTEKLNQLENTFKSVIAQIGPGGTIDPDLKHKIKFVVSKFPQGLFISKLLGEFELIFKEQLSPKQLGFLNVTELVGALSDILRVEFSEEKQDLLVFDADLKPVPPGGTLSSVRNSCLVQPDKKTEASAWVSSPSRNPLSAVAVKKTTWDCPLMNHKEPEQRIYKKPNLVVKPLQLQVEINKPQLSLSVANHDIPPDAVRAKKLCRLPPLDTSTLVGVFVEYIISPSQFYIRIYSRDSSELLEDMMIEMRRCYSNQLVSDRYIMPEYFIQPGHLCCVRISEDKWWYRVIIHRILGKKEVEVFYPDFGNIGTVQKSSLRFLKCCYTKLPAQAIPCSLAWVRPAEEHWTSRAILHFQKLCGLKPLVGVVDEYIDGILNIFLCDTSSNEDVYFHHVLRTEGHAIVCRENAPSKGFSDLNPLALYTNSSGVAAGDTVLTELGRPSQQHYFNEDREIQQQSKQDINDEKSLSHFTSASKELLKDSQFSSLETCKSCEGDLQWSILKPGEPKEDNEDEIPTGMPCLESVTIDDDVWDENWLPLQAKMGKGEGPASHMLTSSLVGKKQYQSHGEMTQKDWCFSASKDIWDDSWQPLGFAHDMKGGIQTPEGPIAQEKNIGTTRIRKQADLQYPLDSSTLPKLEEFYISLIKSQQSAEGSQSEPVSIQTQPKHSLLSSTVPSSAPSRVNSPETHSDSVESSPGSLKSEDFSSSHADTVVKDESQGAIDQLSLILSPQHQIAQKLYIPRSTATAVLGAAARLATSRSLLHWYPSVKGWKPEGQEMEKNEVK